MIIRADPLKWNRKHSKAARSAARSRSLASANFSLNENPCYKINTPRLDIHLICVSKQFVSRKTRAAAREKRARHEPGIYNNILPRQADKEL